MSCMYRTIFLKSIGLKKICQHTETLKSAQTKHRNKKVVTVALCLACKQTNEKTKKKL